MEKLKKYGYILGLLLVLWGCTRQYDHKGKTPLVEVAGKFLYGEDLRQAMPLNLSTEDSALFAEQYIKTWVEDALLFDKAEGNIPDNDKITTLVENYRKALIMHVYQEELVGQKLVKEISESEVEAYYEQNKSLFVLDEPIVKGLFIKIPLHSQGLADVRRWYKRNTQDAIEKLEKYSLRNAVTYDYFYDQWKSVEELASILPIKELKTDAKYLARHRDMELKDTAYHYFLHIEEFQGKGEVKPLNFAKLEIKDILINLKRVDFIEHVKDDLYREASDKNKIIYYYLNSDE